MSTPKKYVGPETGRVYNLAAGDKIDPVAEGIGATGDKSAPSALVAGRERYARIFIRLKTPHETLTCSPILNGDDFARRASIIENWFNSIVRKGNYILVFEAIQITDGETDSLQKGGEV